MNPSILVSYAYLPGFLRNRHRARYRSWVLDSGAFSAHTSGAKIDLGKYIGDCHGLLAGDDPPELVFALDVIGDPEASARNADRMVAEGLPAVPCYHRGSPWHYLDDLARRFPRIALGGLALRNEAGAPVLNRHQKLDYLDRCYGRVWPKWCHAFGCTDEAILSRFPVASADSTSWWYGPMRFGKSMGIGRGRVVPRPRDDKGAFDDFLSVEISHALGIERRIRGTFGRAMAAAGLPPFSLRLAVDGKNVKHLSPERLAAIGAG